MNKFKIGDRVGIVVKPGEYGPDCFAGVIIGKDGSRYEVRMDHDRSSTMQFRAKDLEHELVQLSEME